MAQNVTPVPAWRVPRSVDEVERMFHLGVRVDHLSPELDWSGVVIVSPVDDMLVGAACWVVNQYEELLVCVRWDETGDDESTFSGWTLADAIAPTVPAESSDDPMAADCARMVNSDPLPVKGPDQ